VSLSGICAVGSRRRRLRLRHEPLALDPRLRVIAFDEAGLGDWERYPKLDGSLLGPADVDHLMGDYYKAERDLGWRPTTRFEELVRLMTRANLGLLAT
jgi:GDP-D-mannose dehydratase